MGPDMVSVQKVLPLINNMISAPFSTPLQNSTGIYWGSVWLAQSPGVEKCQSPPALLVFGPMSLCPSACFWELDWWLI